MRQVIDGASPRPESAGEAPRARPEPAVSLVGLTKRFPSRRTWSQMLRDPFGGDTAEVLSDVDLEIPPGEFFGLLGPNGAGKTTLFRILATLVLPDGGSAEVLGRDVREHDTEVRELVVSVIGNERSLYWRLSATENLELFGALHGLDRETRLRRARRLLELVELTDTGSKIVAEFSSGMKQKLLLARALLPAPKVLLLDEPTRSLDPLAARAFRKFLREEMSERLGCTILLATHDTDEAAELCDRVGMLHEGRLLAVGTVEELGQLLTGDTYRLRARELGTAALAGLEEEGAIRDFRFGEEAAGWQEIIVEIPGEMKDASRVLSSLTLQGAEIAHFEHVSVSLTDVMERILAEGTTAHADSASDRATRPTTSGEGDGVVRSAES